MLFCSLTICEEYHVQLSLRSSLDNMSNKKSGYTVCTKRLEDCRDKTCKQWITTSLTYGCLLVLSWAVPWSIVGSDCLPGGNTFGVIVLIDVCVIAGQLIHVISVPKLPPLPPLLGMLLAGFALRNIPVINVVSAIDSAWSSALRSMALTIILIKAGLELDANALRKMKGVCLRLTALPCLVEVGACAIGCYLLLRFSWEWGFLLGFVLGAVTPAVIVPSMLTLQEKQLGSEQGIPTLVIAASSFDDVLAISGFSIILGISFSTVQSSPAYTLANNTTTTAYSNASYGMASSQQSPDNGLSDAGSLALMILRGPLEMVGGIVIGIVLGAFLWFVPGKGQKSVTFYRTVILSGIGILAIFGSRIAGFPGSGALIAIVASFVASFKWSSDKVKVSQNISILWILFEPILFGLIGAEISLAELDSGTVGLGIAVLAIGLLFRIFATFGAVSFSGLNFREKIFVCLAWLPKATVQAAIGPLALDMAHEMNASTEVIAVTTQILTIAVLSILITAPVGAAAIGLTGPLLLQQPSKSTSARVSPQDEQKQFSDDLVVEERSMASESDQLRASNPSNADDRNV